MPNSLLESYIHVLYENKKTIEKKFIWKYFSTRENFGSKMFDFFETCWIFRKFAKNQKFWGKIFRKSKNIFQKMTRAWRLVTNNDNKNGQKDRKQ